MAVVTDSAGQDLDSTGATETHVLDASSDGAVNLPDGLSLSDASFNLNGDDLVISWPDGAEATVEGFAAADMPPHLVTADGAQISGDMAMQMARIDSPDMVSAGTDDATFDLGPADGTAIMGSDGMPIGQVEDLDGSVFAIRVDGTRVELQPGDPVFQGDILESGADGSIGIILADDTTFSMGENGRMVLDEMIYDPGTQEGSVSMSVLEGVFTFVSGSVAKTDPDSMTIDTPVATIGIRGTQVGVNIEGENADIVLMEEADGFVGEVVVQNDGGSVVINQAHTGTTVGGFEVPPAQAFAIDKIALLQQFGGSLKSLPKFQNSNTYGADEASLEMLLEDAVREMEQDAEQAAAGEDAPDEEGEETAEEEAGSEEAAGAEDELTDEDIEELAEFETAAGEEEEGFSDDVTEVVASDQVDTLDTVVDTITPVFTIRTTAGTQQQTTSAGTDNNEEVTQEVEETLSLVDQIRGLAGVAGVQTTPDGGLAIQLSEGANVDFSNLAQNLTVTGTDGNEVIVSGSGIDTIDAGGGNDWVAGSAGDDIIYGGAGDDTLFGRAGNDQLFGGAGDDVLTGGVGDDRVFGGDGDDVIVGTENDGDDVYDGGGGDDWVVYGAAGVDDALWLNLADEDLSVELDDGTIVELQATTATDADPTAPFAGTDALIDIENLVAGAGDDIIVGNGDENILVGGLGDDYLFGGAGDDILIGGAITGMTGTEVAEGGGGNDFLHGGAGFDVVLYSGSFGDFTYSITDGGVQLTGPDGSVDTLVDIEQLRFDDGETIAVGVPPVVTVGAAAGDEDAPISLDISAAITGGIDAVATIEIAGIPEGSTLMVGTDSIDVDFDRLGSGDGVATLTPDQLANLTITPPTNFSGDFTLQVTAMSALGVEGDAETFLVDVQPVADAPTLSLGDVAGDAGTAIPLDITASVTDPSETLSEVTISGIPEGSKIFAGLDDDGPFIQLPVSDDGSVSVPPSLMGSVQLVTPEDFAADFDLTVSATSLEGENGDTATTTATMHVDIEASEVQPAVSVAVAGGDEDSPIALDISITAGEAASITIAGIPEGATLSAGTDEITVTDGVAELTAEQLEGLTLTPAPDSDADFDLTVTATSPSGLTSEPAALPVTVNAVADAPTVGISLGEPFDLNAGHGNDAGGIDDENPVEGGDTPETTFTGGGLTIYPVNIEAGLTDTDGSETLSITIGNVPDGVEFSAGTDNGDGTWSFAPEDLDGLQMAVPPNVQADFSLSVSVTATEAENLDTATTTATVDVAVDAPPAVQAEAATGNEDSAIALDVQVEAQGGEALASVTISGIPAGATLMAGTDEITVTDGVAELSPDQLAGLTITPPADSDADFELTVTATSVEGNVSDPTTVPVSVAAVADAPVVTTNDAAGLEDTAIAIDISSALSDTDGSESITSVSISGIPEGATLMAGTDEVAVTDGTAQLTADQLGSLSLLPPVNFSGDIPLSVTAVSTEADGGSTATGSGSVVVSVAGQVDAPVDVSINAGTDDGGETFAPGDSGTVTVNARFPDADGSEQHSVSVSVPAGFVVASLPEGLSVSDLWTPGEDGTGGTLDVSGLVDESGQLDVSFGVTASADLDADATVSFQVQASATEGGETVDVTASDAVQIDVTEPVAPTIEAGGDVTAQITTTTVEHDLSGLPDQPTAGVDPDHFTLQANNQVTLTFEGESAGYRNSLGFYKIGPNGEITDVDMIFENASEPGSGGSLESGTTVTLDLAEGEQFGLFVIADGADHNDFDAMTDGSFQFRDADGNPATIDSASPQLVFVGADGNEIVLDGPIYHSMVGDGNLALNPDGQVHVKSSATDDGGMLLGFEDLPNLGDADFNDVQVSLNFQPATAQALAPVIVSPAFDANDLDGTTLLGGTVAIDGAQEGDTLSVDPALLEGTGVTVAQTANGLSFSGEAPIEVYETIFQGIAFDSDPPLAGDRTITFGVTDSDGQSSNLDSVDVRIEAPEPPAVNTEDMVVFDLDVSGTLLDEGESVQELTISGLPEGAVLSAGTDNGDGSWTLDGGQLQDLQLFLEAEDVQDMSLQVSARIMDDDGEIETESATVEIETDDYIIGSSGSDDHVSGGGGDQYIFGLAGDDFLKGGGGDDILYGGSGDDTLKGEGGDDWLYGGSGNDELKGGGGDDVLIGGAGNDELKGEGGSDVLIGGDGADHLLGGADDDALFGGAGMDLLEGGDGNDLLSGGAGDDILMGGSGNDTFVMDAESGHDIIKDIMENDKIVFEGQEFDAQDLVFSENEDGDVVVAFSDKPDTSVTLQGVKMSDLDRNQDGDPGEGYSVTSDGDSVTVTIDDNG